MQLGLHDKVVVVSGATGAIGSAICRAFLAEGSLTIAFCRSLKKYDAMIKEFASAEIDTDRIFPYQLDFNSAEMMSSTVHSVISRFGGIDVLVNNAGRSTERPFLAMEESEWEDDININLNITARLLRIVLKHMFIAKKGAIVNISSLVSRRLGRGVSAYAAAKAGINRMTQIIAQEVGSKGIRINAVCPGLIRTTMSKRLTDRSGDLILDRTALNKYGTPGDVARAVLFLASETASSFITGHLMNVDGGLGL